MAKPRGGEQNRVSLTEREKQILQLRQQGLSDYKIGRKIGADPPNITASRKNALRKLKKADEDIAWAKQIGVTASQEGA
jgi:DNA-binding CsgD family transcriptional regulator